MEFDTERPQGQGDQGKGQGQGHLGHQKSLYDEDHKQQKQMCEGVAVGLVCV